MAKSVDNSVLDAALTEIATSTRLSVCSAQPANYAGIAAVSLGSYTLTAGVGGGDFSALADGDTSGRKITVAAQSGNNATASGVGTHIALDNGSVLKFVTTTSGINTTSGQPFEINAWDIEFGDPT